MKKAKTKTTKSKKIKAGEVSTIKKEYYMLESILENIITLARDMETTSESFSIKSTVASIEQRLNPHVEWIEEEEAAAVTVPRQNKKPEKEDLNPVNNEADTTTKDPDPPAAPPVDSVTGQALLESDSEIETELEYK